MGARNGREAVDELARDLASGRLSRRSALSRLAGVTLGALVPGAIAERALAGSCPDGRVGCNGKCCPKHAVCRNGRCKCRGNFKKCGGKCVNVTKSVNHCGQCDHRCETGAVCTNGVCGPACAAGEADCSGVCVDLDNDADNCGECGVACTEGQTCNAGACEDLCTASETFCSGACCTAVEVCDGGECIAVP